MLPAVRPAPAGAAAAGSPAASVPPPAAYGYTPNQPAPGSPRDAANQRAPRQARSKNRSPGNRWRQQSRKQEKRKGEERGGRRKVDLLKRCESRDLVRNRRGEIKREKQQGAVISRTGGHAYYWWNDVKDQQEISCARGGNLCLKSRALRERCTSGKVQY